MKLLDRKLFELKEYVGFIRGTYDLGFGTHTRTIAKPGELSLVVAHKVDDSTLREFALPHHKADRVLKLLTTSVSILSSIEARLRE